MAKLIEELKYFEPLVGKTYLGKFSSNTDTDISEWETILNGQAIRTVHSVNEGEYGGETIIYWDKAKKEIVAHYFTTAGFYTVGTMKIEGNKIVAVDELTGSTTGITAVKSETFITDNGGFKFEAFYLRNGIWEEGHNVTYTVDNTKKPAFR